MRRGFGIGALLRCTVMAAASLLATSQPALADEDDVWFPGEADFVALGSPFGALANVREPLSAGQINLCGFAGDNAFREQQAVTVTGNAVTIRCAGIDAPIVMPFASHVMFGLDATARQERLMHCETRDGSAFYGQPRRGDQLHCLNSTGSRYGRYDKEALRRFVIAWTYLSRAACMSPPNEAAIRQSLASAPPITPDIEESLRRTQVQAELAIRENRLHDAAELYRAALTDHPNWAFGQFNHALLLGELEFYPSAISRMRIYLALSPGASDARAAQDRVYEWEARLPRPAPP